MRNVGVWQSQNVAFQEVLIVDTLRNAAALIPYMQHGEVVPEDMVLVVVNAETLHKLKRIFLEQHVPGKPWLLQHDPNGREIALALLAVECRKQPGLSKELGLV